MHKQLMPKLQSSQEKLSSSRKCCSNKRPRRLDLRRIELIRRAMRFSDNFWGLYTTFSACELSHFGCCYGVDGQCTPKILPFNRSRDARIPFAQIVIAILTGFKVWAANLDQTDPVSDNSINEPIRKFRV